MAVRILIGLVFFLAILSRCTPPDEVLTDAPAQALTFSADTVFFDTLLTDLRSATRRLRVFNPNANAIRLREVRMEDPASPFSLIVNGRTGPSVRDLVLRGQDSLLVIVDARLDPNNLTDTTFLITDRILFDVEGRGVEARNPVVAAFGQDAFYLRDTILPCQAQWTAGKPYVLFGVTLVDTNCRLTLGPGTRVLAAPGAVLIVAGTLTGEGTAEAPVTFSSIRTDGGRRNAPGQWESIVLLGTSRGNVLRHTVIQNASRGLQVGLPEDANQPNLIIENSVIRNMSTYGLWAFHPDFLVAYNNLILNCGTSNVAGFSGGRYFFVHNSTGYSNTLGFVRRTPAVSFSDRFVVDNELRELQPLTLVMANNVVSGRERDEFVLAADGLDDVVYINHNYIRTEEFPLDTLQNLVRRQPFAFDPVDPFTLFPDTSFTDQASPARGAGQSLATPPLTDLAEQFPGLRQDRRGLLRSAVAPALGAYELP